METVVIWLDGLLIVSGLFLGLQLITLLGNLVMFPVLTPASRNPPKAKPKVSLLIPARNEAATLPETLPRVLQQPEALEILVLDDQSNDGTGEVLASFAAQDARLKPLQGKPLPLGWSGKNWACQQLAETARGEILIFTDADVLWRESTLAALLTFRESHHAEFVSVWPRQLTRSFWERVTVPLVDMILLGWLPYWAVRRLPFAAFSAGNGQLMLWTRRAYTTVGTHAAFRNEVLEDVRMAQRAKACGLNVALALGGSVLGVRMYQNPRAMLEGFSKNVLAAHSHSRALLVLSMLVNTLTYTIAWPLALIDARWLIIGLLGLAQRALTCAKSERSLAECPLQPLMAIPLWVIGVRALRRGQRYQWKGRHYYQR